MAKRDEILVRLQDVQELLERELVHISTLIQGDEHLRNALLYRQTEVVRLAFSTLKWFLNSKL
jgi:hypothetical protein